MNCRKKMLLAYCPCRSRSVDSTLGLVWPRSDWDLQQQADYHLGCSDSRFGKHSCFLTEIHLPRHPFETMNPPIWTERLRCTVVPCKLQNTLLLRSKKDSRLFLLRVVVRSSAVLGFHSTGCFRASISVVTDDFIACLEPCLFFCFIAAFSWCQSATFCSKGCLSECRCVCWCT